LSRARLLGLVLAALLVAGLTITRAVGIHRVEQALSGRDLQWTGRDLSLSEWSWGEISGPGIQIAQLEVKLGWPTRVMLTQPEIDLSVWLKRKRSETPAQQRWRPPFTVETTALAVRWDDDTLARDMSGQLYPQVALGDGTTDIRASWEHPDSTIIAGTVHGAFPHPQIHGLGQVAFSIGETMSFELTVPEARLDHPFISQDPMPPSQMSATGTWNQRTGKLSAEGQLGAVGWHLTGEATPDHHALKLRIPLTPLADVAALFGDSIPEASGARMRGELGLTMDISGPPLSWTLEPGVGDLAAEDALPSDFGRGVIRWTRGEDSTVHMTGPRAPGWVSISRAGWMPETVIAAEDIRFRTHPGFDLVAIGEAIANAKSDERMRGGSTITQQLAKNLFLDGRRTLRRKLRELLLALSLEARMSKDAILALYLNIVEFGPGLIGIHEAADAWFLKTPDRLSPREAAFLASILPAPKMWHARIRETGRVPVSRVNAVLDRMRRRGSLSATQHAAARAEILRVVLPAPR
jgi:hypothetical protein